MDRKAELAKLSGRCLFAATELPSEEDEARDLLVRIARIIESQLEMPDFGPVGQMQGERMQGVPMISGQPTHGSMLDGTNGPELTPEQHKAIISLRIEIGLPADPNEREKIKNDYVSGLFRSIEGSGGSIVGHDVKMQAPKDSG